MADPFWVGFFCGVSICPCGLLFFRDFRDGAGIFAPFVNQGLHVVWDRGVELEMLSGARVDEAQGLGVEGLARENL